MTTRNEREAASALEPRPTREAFLWLLLLLPGFLLAYTGAEYYATRLPAARIGEIGMDWERGIPFLPWTILVYLSIDVMYVVSPFICRTRAELRLYVLRFSLVTAVSTLCFLLFPLHFGTPRPQLDGIPAGLFGLLGLVDRPFNQAPSLHISLLVVLWSCLHPHCPKGWRWLLNAWCAAVIVSVLTTWQHHFLDIPAGLLLGAAVCTTVRPRETARPAAVLS